MADDKEKEAEKHIALIKGVVGAYLPGSMEFLCTTLLKEEPKKKKSLAERFGIN